MKEQDRPGPVRPNEDELLAYLDGELEAERQAEIELMLDADWELRADLSRLERRIEMFIEATAYQSPAAIPPIDDLWSDFAGKHNAKSADVLPQGDLGINLFSAFGRRPNYLVQLWSWSARALRWPPRLAAALVVALTAFTAFGFFIFHTERLVSAEELLRRARQAETARMGQLAEPVVYRRYRVHRRIAGHEDSVTLESWKDVKSDRFRQRIADDRMTSSGGFGEKIVAELEKIFEANSLDVRRPLSATDYEAWLKTVRVRSEQVIEVTLPGSQAGLKLTTTVEGPYAVNTITEASLVVRGSNWQAVAQQLKVHAEGAIHEYELNEIAYEVVPLQALTIFADGASTRLPSGAISPTSPHTLTAPSATASPSEADLRAAEVAALYAVHRLQADLTGQIEIVRDSGGQIVARGLVETTERKRQLAESLSHIPLVSTQLQTIEEATPRRSGRSTSPVVTVPGGDSLTATSGSSAFQQRLARYFVEREESPQQTQQRVARLSKAVVSESNVALSEAWALKRLAARIATWPEGELPSEAKQRIEEMKRDHISRLKAHCRALRAQLEPALIAIAGEATGAGNLPPEPSSQAQALLVFKTVDQVYQLTHKLFAGTGFPSETPEQSARQLLNAMARMDGALEL